MCMLELYVQFTRLSSEASGAIGLPEFIAYYASLNKWLRSEIQMDFNLQSVFELLTARAAGISLPATPLPPAREASDGSSWRSTVHLSKRFNIRLEIPRESGGKGEQPTPKLAVQTLAPAMVRYLSEGENSVVLPGTLPFSPVVEVRYPVVDDDATSAANGSAVTTRFEKPLVLHMPHCFDPEAGTDALAMLGAPHGSESWMRIDDISHADDLDNTVVSMNGAEISVALPFAGIFCAFANRSSEGRTAVRLHAFTSKWIQRDASSTLRLHLCPELPDVIEEMELAETSSWGECRHAGHSPLLYLCRGACFRLQYLDQEKTIKWHGFRLSADFTIPPPGFQNERSSPSHELPLQLPPPPPWWRTADDEHDVDLPVFNGTISVHMTEGGDGKHATMVKSAAKRAGLPAAATESGYPLKFFSRLRSMRRPGQPVLQLRERAPHSFTVTWRAPPPMMLASVLSEDARVSSEDEARAKGPAISEGAPAAAGTEQSVAAAAPPPPATASAPASAPTPTQATVQSGAAEMKITHFALELATTEPNGNYLPWMELWCGAGHAAPDFTKVVAERSARKPGGAAKVDAHVVDGLFSYSLDVDPSLFGKLRLCCWAEGCAPPSAYSTELLLPRYKGNVSGVDVAEQMAMTERSSYFEKMVEHVTDGGQPQKHRLGNAPSTNAWGGDKMPQPTPSSSTSSKNTTAMAPVPYDV